MLSCYLSDWQQIHVRKALENVLCPAVILSFADDQLHEIYLHLLFVCVSNYVCMWGCTNVVCANTSMLVILELVNYAIHAVFCTFVTTK